MGFKTVHITDLHENTDLIDAATAIAKKTGAKATYITGDWVGRAHGEQDVSQTLDERLVEAAQSTSQVQGQIGQILQENGIETQEQLQNLSDDVKAQLTPLIQAQNEHLTTSIDKAIEDSYKSLLPSLEKLAAETKIVGVLGNHDLTPGYELLKKHVTFAELTDELKVGPLRVKGAINSYEIPRLYAQEGLRQLLSQYFIPYAEGKPGSDNEQEAQLIARANKQTLDRLMKTPTADVLLTHVQPKIIHNRTGEEIKHGSAVEEYAAKAGSTYAGHFHGAEISVYEGKPQFRPGRDHVFVYEYDDQGKVEAVEIYKVR